MWFAVAISCLVHMPGMANAGETEITSENWTEKVSFKPDLSLVQCKPGQTVDKSNLQEFKALIPDAVQMLITKYNLKLNLTAYEAVRPSDGYIQATNKNLGQAKVVELGNAYNKRGISGYTAGLPFPQPTTGLEVAWNFHYAYGADDGEVIYGVYWVSAGSGIEHSEDWRLSSIRGTGRSDIEPIPDIESFKKIGRQGAGLTYALAPYDKKGFGAVYFRDIEPKDGQGHIYVPSMRRILRNSFGTRGDTWNSTDLFYEDVRGYSGYPEWMDWKLVGKKTVLLPMHSGVKIGKNTAQTAYDFENSPHWNPKYMFEPRPVYLLEVTPKLPDYPYSKQYLYVDAESFHVLYKESYDKKGALWKVMINSGGFHRNEKTGKQFLGWTGTVLIDVQSEHATVFHVYKARVNIGLDPEMFSITTLRRQGT
jgi:Protein of unknown function (DUF1329).